MTMPGGIPTISPRDAAAAAETGGALIVDVRERDEFAAERAPGVALVPLSEFVARHEELPKDRPLPAEARRAAFDAAVAAYERGDFFEAHELLEPAWMGAADLAERDLDQGLIKLAAAFVHGVRGNPRGIEVNLRGARERLAAAVGSAAEASSGLDVSGLVAAIDERLARLAAAPDDASIEPPALPWRTKR